MESANVKIRKWGNSFGVVLPIELIQKQNLNEGSEIQILIQSEKKHSRANLFGILNKRLKRPTQEVLDEIDEDWDSKF